MNAVAGTAPPGKRSGESDRRGALARCRALLAREGFTVSWVLDGPPRRGVRPPDLLASSGVRTVRVFVLLDGEIDASETHRRIRAALKQGETHVWVPWPLRWRALSNLERWGVRGVPVEGW